MDREIIFLIEEPPEGGYTARALGHAIFTEADTWEELRAAVQDAVRRHFEEADRASPRPSVYTDTHRMMVSAPKQ